MKKAFLIFPNQLFEKLPTEALRSDIYLIEDSLFFGDKHHPCNFHKQKLLLHRASMHEYMKKLQKKKCTVTYITYTKEKTITDIIHDYKWKEVITYDPVDYLLEKRLKKSQASVSYLPSQLFLNTKDDNKAYFGTKKQPKKSLKMQGFYQWQRERLDILIEEDKKPTGGKWSYDEENRKKIPKSQHSKIPPLPQIERSNDFAEYKKSILQDFPNHPGSLENFIYPTTHAEAKIWLDDFLANRLYDFGTYEDAIVSNENYLYHSILSPLINIGLITPTATIERTLACTTENQIPLNALEGFIRQIIGWREYMRATYEIHGTQMRTENHWNHKANLPKTFYTGNTNLLPVDNAIKRVLISAYNHHIERLMVMGNIFFLLEIHPDHIYTWFMEMYIDSYDWVMVPNVYSMSQNADGGLTTTKPYFSGSNYIHKMSDYKKDEWSDIWDGLFWNFIQKNQNELKKNHRWSMMISLYLKNETKYEEKIKVAETYKKSLKR